MDTLEQALAENSISKLMLVPKSDMHTHGGKGGRIKYFAEWANALIKPPERPFNDLNDMKLWYHSNIKIHDNGIEGYLKRLEAAFVQAKEDHITVFSLSFNIETIDYLGGIDTFINTLDYLHQTYAPETQYLPELSLFRECDVNQTYDRVEEILNKRWFKSIDICGDELAQPIRDRKSVV